MISQERMEKGLTYLAETDEDYAKAKALVEGMKEILKIKKSQLFLKLAAKTQGEREHQAVAHPEYSFEVGRYQEAVKGMELLRAKRTTETLLIDAWRSVNANRNKGNV